MWQSQEGVWWGGFRGRPWAGPEQALSRPWAALINDEDDAGTNGGCTFHKSVCKNWNLLGKSSWRATILPLFNDYFQGRPLITDVDDDSDNFPRLLLRSPAFLQDTPLLVDLLFPLLIQGLHFQSSHRFRLHILCLDIPQVAFLPRVSSWSSETPHLDLASPNGDRRDDLGRNREFRSIFTHSLQFAPLARLPPLQPQLLLCNPLQVLVVQTLIIYDCL